MVTPPFKYRILWTWDYCTLWDDSYFARGRGAYGPNQRRTYFLEDYKRMVDFSAAHGFNGIIIWGALRAHQNGEGQLKELARYGKQKGVRILPGCGIFSYGGVYYDPRPAYDGVIDLPMTPHPYNLHSWLQEHPTYAALGPDGQPYRTGVYSDVACPSQPENLAWFREALAWLLTEFEVGGVQVEVGDYAVCHCVRCTARRQDNENQVFNVEDMLPAYSAAVETARAVKPDAWVICESYSSYGVPREVETPGFGTALNRQQKDLLAALPEGAIIQWVLDRAVGPYATHTWAPDVYVPTKDNIARIHSGSQWSQKSINEWAVPTVADLVKKAQLSGINGVAMFGEESPASPPNEANYLVFAEFAGCGNPNPDCDLALFYSQTLDPLYGGSGISTEWERIFEDGTNLRLALHQPAQAGSAGKMTGIERQQRLVRLAAEAHAVSARLSGESCRRWSWLENWLWRAEWLGRTSIR
jgi:hypothetical protein